MRTVISQARSIVFRHWLTVLILGLAAIGLASPTAQSQEVPKEPEKPSKREPIYDEKADAKALVATAVKNAKRNNTRVLVMFGGNWCGWCYKLHDVFTKNEDIVPIIRCEYEVVMVDVGSNPGLLASYGKDNNKHGVPFLTVLDENGKVLTNQNTADLEDGPVHDPEKVKTFLEKWTARPLNAEDVLKAGLVRAKAENKQVFVHVGTPWCGWCRVLERFLESHQAMFDKEFVDVKLDSDRMTNGAAVAERLRNTKVGGVPWFAILDSNGSELANSDNGPNGNIGYPGRPGEIAYFVEILQKTSRRLTPAEVTQIKSDLEEYADKHNLR